MTTTSPRLHTGLRSFTQLAGMAEPVTGALTTEAVRDLTRRAGRLDVVRAVGQVRACACSMHPYE